MRFITDGEQFFSCKKEIEKLVRIESQLPDQVFCKRINKFSFEEFDWAMSADFWVEIKTLAQSSGDKFILVAVLDPDPQIYYKKEFGFFNWAVLPVTASAQDYWNFLNLYPAGSPADSLLSNSEKIVWVVPSGKWAIWGERSFGVCVLGCLEKLSESSWHDVQWALKTAMPHNFHNNAVPLEFSNKLLENYQGCLP